MRALLSCVLVALALFGGSAEVSALTSPNEELSETIVVGKVVDGPFTGCSLPEDIQAIVGKKLEEERQNEFAKKLSTGACFGVSGMARVQRLAGVVVSGDGHFRCVVEMMTYLRSWNEKLVFYISVPTSTSCEIRQGK